jgi:hypothetical protein
MVDVNESITFSAQQLRSSNFTLHSSLFPLYNAAGSKTEWNVTASG